MPLIVQSTKKNITSFNLSIINSQMQIATKRNATLAETKVAIVNMYQNGTTAQLSSQAQKAACALAQYIHANKTSKKFAFVLGKDYQDQQLLLLTIANHPAPFQDSTSLQRAIKQTPINAQKQEELSLVKQLPWVTKALHEVEFGILFWIYQHRLSSQEALLGTKQVPAQITATNFQRVKTAHEQLQDQAWAKMIEVIQNLTSRQLKIHGDDQQLPSQAKIDASHIVLAIQKIIISDDEISKAASKLMKEANIEVQPIDKTGAMIITIKNYGHDKIMTIFGFKATATPREVAQAKINVAKDGASLPTRLLTQVFHDQPPTASHVSAPMKDGVTFTFKSATAVNDQGESTLTYEVTTNPQVVGTTIKEVTFVVSGFETQAQALGRLAQAAIQNLIESNFTTGIDKTKIASSGKPLKTDVIADIKKQINNTHAKVLISLDDITITSDNIARAITIIIHNHGLIKTIIINGFRSIEDYLKLGSSAIKDYLDQLLRAIPSSGGALEIPEGITSTQFDAYVKAMGVNNGIYKFAEQYWTQITSLTIPSSFTSIGNWFQRFNQITSLTIPNSVTTIGVKAFYKAQLTSLLIPNSVTTIGNDAFHDSPLTTLSLGNQLQTIGDSAFFYAQLTSLRIPNSVTTIEMGAFYSAQLTSLIIPNSVTKIGNLAFALSPLTTLSLGDGLLSIGDSAFKNSTLISLTIPNSVTKIGNLAFRSSLLTTLSLGDGLLSIGDSAFYNAQLTSLDIPNSVTKIGNLAFALSPLTTLSLGEKLQTIGTQAFVIAKLTSLIIPASVTFIGDSAFSFSPLKNVNIFEDVTLGRGAFRSIVTITLIKRPA